MSGDRYAIIQLLWRCALVPKLSGKRLELLKEVVPRLTHVAVLWNPNDPDTAESWSETQAAAHLLGIEVQSLEVRGLDEFESAFEAATRGRAGALLVLPDGLTNTHATRITELAADGRLPAIYPWRHFVLRVVRGGDGLISYGPDSLDLIRRVAVYIDKILKGAKPADLPVEQPREFELVINMKTAKALGLTIPRRMI